MGEEGTMDFNFHLNDYLTFILLDYIFYNFTDRVLNYKLWTLNKLTHSQVAKQ